jgi:hypothetical protein
VASCAAGSVALGMACVAVRIRKQLDRRRRPSRLATLRAGPFAVEVAAGDVGQSGYPDPHRRDTASRRSAKHDHRLELGRPKGTVRH